MNLKEQLSRSFRRIVLGVCSYRALHYPIADDKRSRVDEVLYRLFVWFKMLVYNSVTHNFEFPSPYYTGEAY